MNGSRADVSCCFLLGQVCRAAYGQFCSSNGVAAKIANASVRRKLPFGHCCMDDYNLQDTTWFWGSALVCAGVANWIIGRRQNAKRRAAVRSIRFRDALVYRARHTFMSLPIETWSIPLVAGGIGILIHGAAA